MFLCRKWLNFKNKTKYLATVLKQSVMKKTFILLLTFGLFITALAQETKPVSKNKPSEDVTNLQLANDLARYGFKTFSADALIQAAKIMGSVKTQDLKYESFKQEPAPKEQATKKSNEGYDLASILAAAKKYADGDPKLLASIAEIEKANQATRGRVGGPGEKYAYAYGNTTDTYEINFIAGRLAEISVSGDGDTDLDLYVYDSNLNIVAEDADYTDKCYVSWVPAWTGKFIVRIANRGPILNKYHLVTN